MKLKSLIAVLFLNALAFMAFAQDPKPDTTGVLLDVKTEKALEKHKEFNKKNPLIPGFRVQVYAGSSRAQAMSIRQALADSLTDYAVYIIYKQPTFRVRVGDFRSRFEAQKLLNGLKMRYPASFIVPDDINPNPVLAPKPEEENDAEPQNP
jgi:hypothetical protein